jgi:YkoY family integral membrane protein
VGLVAAFVLRILLILTASWVLHYWQFEVAGAAYLLWLVFQHFASNDDDAQHHGPRFASVWQAVPTIALTDLAFSLDSVTTAIALSRDVWIVLLGGAIGIVALRFMAQLFIRWLDKYEYLEDAGYITVALVGIRLLIRVVNESWVPPQWLMIGLIAAIFAWGFSKKTPQAATGSTTPSLDVDDSYAVAETVHMKASTDEDTSKTRQPASVASLEKDAEEID